MRRVVIADDSATARMFVRRCLEIAGCRDAEFLEAANGAEALEILREWGADLVVSDLNMPVLDGASLVEEMRREPRFSKVAVLIVSSVANTAKENQLRALGADAVLSKPVSPAAMAAALRELNQKQKD